MMNDKGLISSSFTFLNRKYGGKNNGLQGNEKYTRTNGK